MRIRMQLSISRARLGRGSISVPNDMNPDYHCRVRARSVSSCYMLPWPANWYPTCSEMYAPRSNNTRWSMQFCSLSLTAVDKYEATGC